MAFNSSFSSNLGILRKKGYFLVNKLRFCEVILSDSVVKEEDEAEDEKEEEDMESKE